MTKALVRLTDFFTISSSPEDYQIWQGKLKIKDERPSSATVNGKPSFT